MQTIIALAVVYFVGLMDARPQMGGQKNLMFWNYLPFVHNQQQMMSNKLVKQRPYFQYPNIDVVFKVAPANTPSVQRFHYQSIQAPLTRKHKPKPTPTPTKTTTTSISTTPPTPRTMSTRSNNRQTSLSPSAAPVAKPIKYQLADGIFEMARNIQANIQPSDRHQRTGKFNIFSPINVATLLSLLELGAKGQTNHELQHTLGFDNLQFPNHHSILGQMLKSISQSPYGAAQINMANGIFMQTGYVMEPDYRTSVETIYQSQVTTLDFQQRPDQATKFINDWVRQQTNGKIQNILNAGIDTTTRMLLASAVHFKALWESSFVLSATAKRPFYPDGKENESAPPIMVDTMVNGGAFMYHESQEHGCSIMALPFKGHTTTMYIILPDKTNVDKLKQLETKLSHDAIDGMIEKMKERHALITLPRMRLSDTMDLKNVLVRMGAASVFDNTRSDLSGMTGLDSQYRWAVDGLVHKIDLTINETGTEAAAATITNLSREEFEVEFRVDGPFMFIVRHEATRMPLFYGSVLEPAMDL